ncbi:MAG: GatB/YqeY domain-containing protein [Candidatus Marinimicrobia bacterium]|nr:GatB/YqeY domain-containing protein [Candidatus Neomarinimicrobiota bacterium]
MSLFEKIQSDMYTAMKAGEKQKAITLRSVIAKLKDKKIAKRDTLSEAEEIKTIQTLVKQRRESENIYMQAGREELAKVEKYEAELMEIYLPTMMSEDDIRSIVEDIVAETGASSMSDMGKVMPEVLKRGAGQIDGKVANIILRELLG